MKDNLFDVVLIDGGKRKPRTLRLLGGQFILGWRVTLTKDVWPFVKKQYIVVGFEKSGTPQVELVR